MRAHKRKQLKCIQITKLYITCTNRKHPIYIIYMYIYIYVSLALSLYIYIFIKGYCVLIYNFRHAEKIDTDTAFVPSMKVRDAFNFSSRSPPELSILSSNVLIERKFLALLGSNVQFNRLLRPSPFFGTKTWITCNVIELATNCQTGN